MITHDAIPQIPNPLIAASGAANTQPIGDASQPLAVTSAREFPEFPTEAYVGVLAEFADLLSHYYESPKEFIYFSALLLVGTVLSGRVRADFGSLATQPRLYGVKIGPVGTSKKSTADNLAEKYLRRVLNEVEKTEDDEYFLGTVDVSSQWMFILPGAGSGEGVLTTLETNKRVFLRYDEFERFAKKANADGSVLGTAINELFESTTYANATKDSIRNLSGAFLGFSANFPLEQFESTSGVGRLEELGLWSRLIFVVGDRRATILHPLDPPEEKMKPIVDRLAEYLKALPRKKDPKSERLVPDREIKLSLSVDAQALWSTYETEVGHGPDTTRLDIIGMRLMAILAVTSGKKEIDAEIVNAVLAFLKYQKTIRELYKPSRAETIEAKVDDAIMRCVRRAHARHKTPISGRDIRRNTSIERTYGVTALNLGLERLVHGQKLERTKTVPYKYSLGPEAD